MCGWNLIPAGNPMGYNQMPGGVPMAYNQIPTEEQIKLQCKLCEKYGESQIRINEAEMKERISVDAYNSKLRSREEAKERERALVEVWEMSKEGELYIQTKNTSVAAKPRTITNMKSPRMVRYRNVGGDEACCYKLIYSIGEKEDFLFLDSEKIGKVSYLIAKFTAAGIYFEIQPRKIGPLLIQLLGDLCSYCKEEVIVSDEPGWMKLDDGQFKFFSEEEPTWRQIKKKSK